MRFTVAIAAAALMSLPTATLAKSPADIADLVGARAPGAESEMQSRGYVDVRNRSFFSGFRRFQPQNPIARGNLLHR